MNDARERYVAAILAWVELFGEAPSANDWSTTIREQSWRAERYRATGRSWPSMQNGQKLFGSWSAALAAAGQVPRPAGAHGHQPNSPVSPHRTHCRNGHPISETYRLPSGKRLCRLCRLAKERRRRHREALA